MNLMLLSVLGTESCVICSILYSGQIGGEWGEISMKRVPTTCMCSSCPCDSDKAMHCEKQYST